MIAEKVGENTSSTKFNIGDRVRFKAVKEFEGEFGSKWKTSVLYHWAASGGMDYLHGEEFTISEISGDVIKGHNTKWTISTGMLVKITKGKVRTKGTPFILESRQEVTTAGIKGVVLYGIKGYYIINPVGKNDAFFKELFIANPHEFVNSIVGYETEKHTYFPEVKTLEDLTKVYLALKERESIYFTPATEEECLEWKVVEKPAMPEESYVYKDGDIITFKSTDTELRVFSAAFNKWFCSSYAKDTDGYIFEVLLIKDKYKFIKDVLGYEGDEGEFPVLKSAEDLTKVINALKERDEQLFYENLYETLFPFLTAPDDKNLIIVEEPEEESTYINEHAKGKQLNIFDLSTDHIAVEKSKVIPILDIFNYNV